MSRPVSRKPLSGTFHLLRNPLRRFPSYSRTFRLPRLSVCVPEIPIHTKSPASAPGASPEACRCCFGVSGLLGLLGILRNIFVLFLLTSSGHLNFIPSCVSLVPCGFLSSDSVPIRLPCSIPSYHVSRSFLLRSLHIIYTRTRRYCFSIRIID